jgi:thiosulfate/3-mercaptopyruvate sulfurtransferase
MSEVLVTAKDLEAMSKSEPVVIIDTRNPDAYAAGHIPGAVNIHEIFTYLATSTPEGIAELKETFAKAFGAAGLSGKETAVVYEQSMNSGFGQSCRGYYLLSMLGYPKAKVLHGGIDAWMKADMPVSMEAATPVPADFPIDPAGASVLIDWKDMLAALEKPQIAILDVRDVDEWIADSS